MSPFDRTLRLPIHLSYKLRIYLEPFTRYSELFVESRKFFLLHVFSLPPLRVQPLDLCQDLWRQSPQLSCPRVYMMLCLAVSKEQRLVTDRRTDGQT